jgi:DeoR/GlpR family transcriptional regulator of sugar metabolism
MRLRSNVVQTRVDALRSVIEASEVGSTVDFVALRDALPPEIRSGTNEHALKHALNQLRRDLEAEDRRASLEIGKSAVRRLIRDETLFDQNMQRNVSQKRAIAAALWHWLFDFPLAAKLSPQECWTGFNTIKQNDRIKERMERKRSILRSRINPAIVIDAGSTNTVAITRFLATATSIPFLIKEHKKDFREVEKREEAATSTRSRIENNSHVDTKEDIWYYRLIAPLFLTNSIVIADKIARSEFRQSIILRVIGGTDRPERRSICGELSLLWLRACDQDGKMVSVDLAIIGATGVDNKRFEIPVLGCDAAEEASLKARLLAMSQFRIVLFDSDKLVKGGSSSMFAAISEGDVDLIVSDVGTDRPTERAVDTLARACNENGVGLLLAKM